MNKEGHAVSWRGQTLYLSDRTDKVKQGFVAFAVNRTLDNARAVLRADHYYAFERRLLGHLPEWTTVPDGVVVSALAEPDAMLQLVRLHLGATPEELPDDEIKALIAAKEPDPDSDYSRALRLVAENADPKASGAFFGSQAPKDASEPRPNSAGPATFG